MKLEALQSLADSLIKGEAAPPDVAVSAGMALQDFLSGSEPSLDAAFGITRRQGMSVATRLAMQRRNKLLRELAELYHQPSIRAVVLAMLADLNRYESGRWRFDSRSSQPPPDPKRSLMYQILCCGRVPNERQTRTIIGNENTVPISNDDTNTDTQRNQQRIEGR